jgi:hypothetical protein
MNRNENIFHFSYGRAKVEAIIKRRSEKIKHKFKGEDGRCLVSGSSSMRAQLIYILLPHFSLSRPNARDGLQRIDQ